LSRFDPENIPKTQALLEQKVHSLKGWDKWYEDILQEGILPRTIDKVDSWEGRPDCATTYALLKSAKAIRGLESETHIALKTYLFKLGVVPWRVPGTGRGGAKFPPLPEARSIFSSRFGGSWPWTEEFDRWQQMVWYDGMKG
jgi:hypothetical protein